MYYKTVFSRRRTLAAEITEDGGVLVRAPYGCPRGRIESFLAGHAEWLRVHTARQKERAAARPEPGPEERERLVSLAKSVLPEKTARWAAVMGLRPAGVRITGAKKRFGSCSAKNSLCFSWRLMRYPDEAVDYVVVHELAHIVYKNHGPRFHALVASYLPDAAARRRLLRE